MKILVTGGSGFIGHNIVRQLHGDGHEVAITNAVSENNPVCQRFYGRNLRKLDISDCPYTDVLFHQAANNETQNNNEKEMLEANVDAPIELFNKFADAGCKRFIYASSTAVYGNAPVPYYEDQTLDPLTPYAKSKVLFDEFAMQFGKDRSVSVVGLRYSNVYGPGEMHKGNRSSMIRQLIAKMASNEHPKLYWDGTQKRDWVCIRDVVIANMLAMKYQGEPIIFNIGTGRSWTYIELINIISKMSGNGRHRIYFIPNPYPKTYQNHTECNIDKAIKSLGYDPKFDITRGIEHYLQHWN